MKKLFFAPLAALFLSFGAHAQSLHTLTVAEMPRTDNQQLSDAIIGVEARPSPGAVIATDALYGGIAGLAVGGGIALITDSGNWGRDLAVGAGVGLIAGAIFGAVDAASYGDRGPGFAAHF